MHKTIIVIIVFVVVIIGVWYFVLQEREIQTATDPEGNPTPTIVFSPTFTPDPSITILAVGDIMLGRYVETLMREHGDQYPFAKIGSLFRHFDIVFGNLEGPIPQVHAQTANNSTNFSFKSEVAQLLADNYFDIVSLANNHTADKGEINYTHTRGALQDVGITSFGHPTRMEQATSVATMHTKDKRIAFVGLNSTFGNFDTDEAVALIASTEVQTHDFVIVSMHWGDEYVLRSNLDQQTIARALIDAGADVIIGHHPHVVQEIEEYNGKLIFYSLGNFVFDQYFSDDTQQGLMIVITLDDQTQQYQLIPIQSELSQPRIMTPEEQQTFLQALADRSSQALQGDIKEGVIHNKSDT